MSKSDYDIDPEDQLRREIVGPWAQEKHKLLAGYVDASRGARARFAGRPFFLDLYCGPGRVKIRDTQTVKDGGALTAVRSSLHPMRGTAAPFHGIIVADKERSNVEACSSRMAGLRIPVHTLVGKAEDTVADAVRMLPRDGIHVAYLDPYAIDQLPVTVIRQLSTVPNVDLVMHFASADLNRNLENPDQGSRFESVAPGWNNAPLLRSKREQRQHFFKHWADLVEECGYHLSRRPYRVRNSKQAEMYVLVLASKNPLGPKIWDSLRPHPQGELDL